MKPIAILKKTLAKLKLQGAFISCPLNVRYLTGFGGKGEGVVGSLGNPEGFLLVTRKDATLLVDSRYEGAARQVRGIKTYVFSKPKRALEIAELVQKKKIKILGIEDRFLTYEDGLRLKKVFKNVTLKNISDVLLTQRATKSSAEIALLKKAALVTDKAFTHIIKKIRPGIKEIEISDEIERFVKSHGMTLSFSIIVGSGPNSSIPHHFTGERKLKKGDTVILDFGAAHKGYHADMTRTIFIGKPSKRQKEVYDLVLQANKAAIKALKSGIIGGEIDSIARKTLGKYAKYFTHSLGHGVGLVIHEDPKLKSKSNDKLNPNMVFTIEPGVYIKGAIGVRIEDLVLMTKKGPLVLSKTPKDLLWT